jgi:hypothetical protein
MAYPYFPYPNYPNYPQPIQQTQQIQNGGIVNVKSAQDAMDYIVAQGTSVTFIDSGNMKLYVKTRSFSPMEQPVFEEYDIVKKTSEIKPKAPQEQPIIEYAEKAEIEALKGRLSALEDKFNKPNNEDFKRGKHNG